MPADYQLVELANGTRTLFSHLYGEKMHPGLGPAAEAELLYVRQLNICERLQTQAGEFVIWDVGLGAAANALATLHATREIPGRLRLVSFDNTTGPLEFALENAGALGYVAGYEHHLAGLLRERWGRRFQNGKLQVEWDFLCGDFPTFLTGRGRPGAAPSSKSKIENPESVIPAPHAIFYDAFSPAKNPAMWTLPVFEQLFRALDAERSCTLTTYSRSTMIRATLLLAGFYVGVGHATGMKEETTIAANQLSAIAEPLDSRWLARALRSDSAEPLYHPAYSRTRLAPATAQKLRAHPQFSGAAAS